MSDLPNIPRIPGGGSRADKAARLMAEAEAKKKQAQAQAEAQAGAAAAQQAGAQFHAVRKGETLQSIAQQHGQTAAALWNHPLNSQLRERVGSPDKIGPGDGLYLPSQEEEQGTGPVGQGEYVVKQGDCISSIAKDRGHFWETIWNDPGNSELKAARQDPNVLLPGDHVAIPELQPKQESGQTELRHRFVRKGEPAFLPLQILHNDRPMANEPYELRVDDQTFTGTTDPQGKLEVRIPGNARRATLTVGTEPRRMQYELDLGAVDPIESMTGVQQRLRNLGYRGVRTNGTCEEKTAAALRAFQRANQLEETGAADENTRRTLKQKHGS